MTRRTHHTWNSQKNVFQAELYGLFCEDKVTIQYKDIVLPV